ncbi:MAG TPA: RdgB/HAM1 family non-canonical purine NTP pyrophosphatase [Thermomicrobiales bacterium]|nr:RdgB/HAM1 family non-canonical purine NTP pyrophosphatase [Thermomicrobiales bacterium]
MITSKPEVQPGLESNADASRYQLMIASTNRGKISEFRQLLPSAIELLTPYDIDVTFPPETGETFAENATVKAMEAARQAGMMAIADDSGLEVDALGGLPGVRSARYAGEPPSDERNRQKLLTALSGVPPEGRQARFRCVVALAAPAGTVSMAEGVCEGAIAQSARGTNGFGYDPIFLLPTGRTMAELSSQEKNQISHRARAYHRILPSLLAAFGLHQSEEG